MTNASNFYVILLFFFIFMLLFSFVLNQIFYKFFSHFQKNNTESNRWTTEKKPTIGGIVFIISFLVIALVVLILYQNEDNFYSPDFLAFLGGSFFAFVIGLIDDTKRLLPYQKFLLQSGIALILMLTGNTIGVFNYFFVDAFITYIWVVGMMNAINFLDNMDGMAAILTAEILSSIIIVTLLSPNFTSPFFLLFLIGIMAFLFSFLYYNWPPSKFFMGDSGSMFLGFILAYVGIKFLWDNPVLKELLAFQQLTLIWLIYLWPITDMLIVVLERLSVGKKPWEGGKDHTNHHLIYLGLKEKHVLLLTLLLHLLINALVLLFFQIKEWNHFFWLALLSFTGSFTLFFAMLIFVINKPQR